MRKHDETLTLLYRLVLLWEFESVVTRPGYLQSMEH
jgi:hypothetical protein